MGATPLDFRERVAALRGAGLSPVQIGHRLHYSVGYVHQAIADLEHRTPAPRGLRPVGAARPERGGPAGGARAGAPPGLAEGGPRRVGAAGRGGAVMALAQGLVAAGAGVLLAALMTGAL
jgi:hypothetical protein